MQLAVRDVAVKLALCAEHGEALAATGWAARAEQLDVMGMASAQRRVVQSCRSA